MPPRVPKIDPRTYDDIVAQMTTLVRHYTGWQPVPGALEPDAGTALISIFGHMVEMVIEHLNQAPEKNFLAFLDLIGTQIMPPRAARVPVTFTLAPNSPTDALVPARTQVAAPPEAGAETEVIFETDRDLVVTRAQLVAAIVHDPQTDTYANVTRPATGEDDTAFAALRGTTRIEHSLYLAQDALFMLAAPKTVTIVLESPHAAALGTLPIAWEVCDGAQWQPVPVTHTVQGNQWRVTFAALPALVPRTIHGITTGWVRARYTQSLSVGTQVDASITRITVSAQVVRTGLTPGRGFANSVPLDLSKDFYPFGEQPRLNDAFYLALPEEAAAPGATVTVTVTLSAPAPVPVQRSSDLQVRWEAWNGSDWAQVDAFTEGAGTFTATGPVKLTLPTPLAPRTVNGETGYWLRARIVQGHYGTPIQAVWNDMAKRIVMHGGYSPPVLASLRLDCTATRSAPVTACVTANDLTYVNCTAAVSTGAPPVQLFTAPLETRPALYLGFDQRFDNRPMMLYVQVDPPQPGEVARAVSQAVPDAISPQVIWEYASGAEDWRALSAVDETDAFATSGLIRFLGPPDLSQRPACGQTWYWLRARWDAGTFLVPPRLRRVRTNTTWATQAITLQDEILGSSTGETQQVLRTVQAPVLLGQRLEVREPGLLSPSEQAVLEALEGQDAITMVRDEAGQVDAIWVRWHAVADFYSSGPRDRHYVLDHLTGEIRFGDGRYGMVPPAGRNNLRLASYRTSGGVQGNRPAGTITQLKTALPYVAGVTNHEAATGGADQETLAEVQERGPKALRHRGRAVTAQDMEDLACEAAPEVARVRTLTPEFDPITLGWLPTYDLPVKGAGEISIEANWDSGGASRLTVTLHGPGQGRPYVHQDITRDQKVLYTVTAEQYQPGDVWRVTVMNRVDDLSSTGQITITYPGGGLLRVPLDVPSQSSHATAPAHRPPGQVEMLVVPRRPGPQPTPELPLLTQVQEAVRARSTPTLVLRATEPAWVKVTVSAEVVPTSLDVAETLRATVVAALERFLHPLTGREDGRGWPFGRRPHLSDLYTLLAAVSGVHHVRTLSVVNEPSLVSIDPTQDNEAAEDDMRLQTLEAIQQDRFLIYSGQHNISIITAPDGTRA